MMRRMITLLATLVVAGAVIVTSMSGGPSAPKAVTTAQNLAGVSLHVYRTNTTPGGSGLRLHTDPSSGSPTLVVAPEGATVTAHCFTRGTVVYGDGIWEAVTYAGRSGYMPDFYLAIHWQKTADLVAQGVPDCSTPPAPQATLANAPQAPAPPSGSLPAVWVGSPIDGAWSDSSGCSGAHFPSVDCSLPSVHHYSTSATFADWAVDLQHRSNQTTQAGQQVVLYAAPQNPSQSIYAGIVAVNSPCGNGSIADGGYQVIVGFYTDPQLRNRIGTATYAHINPASGITAGKSVGRWGTVLGTVGNYTPNGCWSASHLHFQMATDSKTIFACFNRGWRPSQVVNRTNFLGFIGGNYAHASRQACP